MKRRVYYDHEPAYREVAARGGHGWADFVPSGDSYEGLAELIAGRDFSGATILDLGCGGGQAGLAFAAVAREIVGVDFSETAIALARDNARAHPCARFVVGDCIDPPVPSHHFDWVLDSHTLHCLLLPEHRRAFLSHVVRALVPGGHLFSHTMSCEGGFEPDAFDIEGPELINRRRTRIWVSQAHLCRELTEVGLSIVEQRRRPLADVPNPGDMLWTIAQKPAA